MVRVGSAGQALPSVEREQQMGSYQKSLAPFIYKLISGEPVEGITPRMAQQFMSMVKPDDLMTMHDRGIAVDPNWYQQYIPSGTVTPKTYQNIMQYSSAFGGEEVDPTLRGGFSQWGADPRYALTSTLPTWRQSMLQNQYDTMRMGMEGKTFDPHYGDWIYDPSIQWAALSQAGQNIGMEGSPWTLDDPYIQKTIGEAMGEAFKSALRSGFGQDTTMPLFSQSDTETITDAIRGKKDYQGDNLRLTNSSTPRRMEAVLFGIEPQTYEEIANTVEEKMRANPRNPQAWAQVKAALEMIGLTEEELNAKQPSWWRNIQSFIPR